MSSVHVDGSKHKARHSGHDEFLDSHGHKHALCEICPHAYCTLISQSAILHGSKQIAQARSSLAASIGIPTASAALAAAAAAVAALRAATGAATGGETTIRNGRLVGDLDRDRDRDRDCFLAPDLDNPANYKKDKKDRTETVPRRW